MGEDVADLADAHHCAAGRLRPVEQRAGPGASTAKSLRLPVRRKPASGVPDERPGDDPADPVADRRGGARCGTARRGARARKLSSWAAIWNTLSAEV